MKRRVRYGVFFTAVVVMVLCVLCVIAKKDRFLYMLPRMFCVDNTTYVCYGKEADGDISNIEILGMINKCCSAGMTEMPTEHEQTNYKEWIGASYGTCNDQMYLLYDDKWMTCIVESTAETCAEELCLDMSLLSSQGTDAEFSDLLIDSSPAIVKVAGIEYQKDRKFAENADSINIIGTITSYHEQGSLEDDQTNWQTVVGASYGIYDNHLYVLLDNGWYHFRRCYADSASFRVQGKIYHCTGEYADEKVYEQIEIAGCLEMYNNDLQKYPLNDKECNVEEWVGASYGINNENMYLHFNGVWLKCYDITEWVNQAE